LPIVAVIVEEEEEEEEKEKVVVVVVRGVVSVVVVVGGGSIFLFLALLVLFVGVSSSLAVSVSLLEGGSGGRTVLGTTGAAEIRATLPKGVLLSVFSLLLLLLSLSETPKKEAKESSSKIGAPMGIANPLVLLRLEEVVESEEEEEEEEEKEEKVAERVVAFLVSLEGG
jgi:hypothetical protein